MCERLSGLLQSATVSITTERDGSRVVRIDFDDPALASEAFEALLRLAASIPRPRPQSLDGSLV